MDPLKGLLLALEKAKLGPMRALPLEKYPVKHLMPPSNQWLLNIFHHLKLMVSIYLLGPSELLYWLGAAQKLLLRLQKITQILLLTCF